MNQEELETLQRKALQKTMTDLALFNYEAGVVAERERILELIDDMPGEDIYEAIALIKGEI
jgi:hypothetical protein